MKKRILILEFRQETNTFNPVVMTKEMFNGGKDFEGEEIFQTRLSTRTAVCGAAAAFREAGAAVIPTVFASAPSGGRVADDVLEFVMERVRWYGEHNEFDAIYASLHGATCTVGCDDACGKLTGLLRELAGEKPVVASFDLHANITERVLNNLDAVCGYRTYPHVDFYETGYRAARRCIDLLEGRTCKMAAAAVPLLVPPAGYTSNEGSFGQLLNWGKELIDRGVILDFTLFPVQPWLDIPEIASRIIVIAREANAAKEYAELMAGRLSVMGDAMQPELLSVDEIIDIAEKNERGKPVILSEFADSPNGGCVGDSVAVPLRLLERGSKLRAGVPVVDPEAVKQAFRLGVGATGEFTVGAAFTPDVPGPLKAEGTVLSLHDGRFILEGPAGRGSVGYIGNSAVVRFGTVDILLQSRGSASGDPQLLRHFGIEPSLYDLVVVKANTSFRLPYGKISDLIYCADTPGAGAANLKRFNWKNLPAGMYPFVKDIAPEAASIK